MTNPHFREIGQYRDVESLNYYEILLGQGKTEEEKAKILIRKVEELSGQVGTRVPLKEIGVKEEDLDLLASKALLDGSLGNNRVQPSKEQVKRIYAALM